MYEYDIVKGDHGVFYKTEFDVETGRYTVLHGEHEDGPWVVFASVPNVLAVRQVVQLHQMSKAIDAALDDE
jgi:hypothetical protein